MIIIYQRSEDEVRDHPYSWYLAHDPEGGKPYSKTMMAGPYGHHGEEGWLDYGPVMNDKPYEGGGINFALRNEAYALLKHYNINKEDVKILISTKDLPWIK